MQTIAEFKQKPINCFLLDNQKARPFRPGDKREKKPVIDKNKCIKCGLCYIFCPDGAIKRIDEGYYDVELDWCKGCGICELECWFGAISMIQEEA